MRADLEEQIVELTRAGVSRRELAERFGCSLAAVAGVRTKHGVKEPRIARKHLVQVLLSDEERAQLEALAQAWKTSQAGALRRLIGRAAAEV